ncbi:hypothetical protein BDV96DRAFT_21797 [Lophiotrema nucula]|uniref:Mid2 domain-containing protein n=1 Tax=Lophiotrema nucula TaxID=690887 RepID=A0A6A5ZDE1_9PLEO|nr:hypothetical protein BDV96DRAFT_21797 [Lophiotrema nucula]
MKRHAFLSWFAVSRLVGATCYNPLGTVSDNVPCHLDGDSACCAQNDSCLTNGLCVDKRFVKGDGLSSNNLYYRGACTSSDFNTTGPNQCSPICKLKPGQGDGVLYCGNDLYCCEGDSSDCCSNNSSMKFNRGAPSVYAIAGDYGTNSSIPSTSSVPLPTLDPAGSKTPKSHSKSSKSGNSRLLIGLAIGLPLGLLQLVSVIGMLWWMRKQEDRQRKIEEILRLALKEQSAQIEGLEDSLWVFRNHVASPVELSPTQVNPHEVE